VPEVAEDADQRQLQLLDTLLAEHGPLLVQLARDHLPGELRQVPPLGGVDHQQVRVLRPRGSLRGQPGHVFLRAWSSLVSASIALMLRGSP
jgi:hypothetical protein